MAANDEAQVGYGADVAYKVKGSTGVFSPITTLVSVEGPGPTRDKIDKTRLKDPVMRYAPKKGDPGEITLNLHHVSSNPANQAFKEACNSPATVYFTLQLSYPDGGIDEMDGFPSGYSVSGMDDDNMVAASVPFTIDGPIRSTYPTPA